MKTFKEFKDEEHLNEVTNWKEAYKSLGDVKTSVGVPLQQEIKDLQRALIIVMLKPSLIKPYLDEKGIDFPESNKINKLIDIISKMSLPKEKL